MLKIIKVFSVFAFALFFSSGLTGCYLKNSLALVDPIFVKFDKTQLSAYKQVARKTIVLPYIDAQAKLYEAVDNYSPKNIFLSPLLATEIPFLLDRDENTNIFYVGPVELKPSPRLYTSVFYKQDAAEIAAKLMASILNKLHEANEKLLCLALFPASSTDSSAQEVFSSTFYKESSSGQLIVEQINGANKANSILQYKSTDYRLVYIALEITETEEWLESVFSKDTIIIVEYPLLKPDTGSSVNYYICWDMAESLKDLTSRYTEKRANNGSGIWKIVQF